MAVNNAYRKYKNIVANNDKVATNSIGKTLSNRGIVAPGGLGANILASENPNMMTADNRTGTGSNLPLSAGGGKTLPASQNATLVQNHLKDNSAQSTAKNVNASGAPVTDAVNNGNSVNSNITINGKANANANGGNTAVIGATAPTISGNSNMSLSQYIAMMGGVDPNRQYNQSVKSAIADYERQKATYGSNAEALAGMGLTNSGTSNYLDQAAYGSMQAAKAQAAAQRDANLTALAGQYINYQAQQEQQRQNTLMEAYNNAVKLGLAGENMQKYLKAIVPNISQEEIDGLTVGADQVAGVDNVNRFDELSQRIATMQETMADEAIVEMLKAEGAYTEEEINNVLGTLNRVNDLNTQVKQQEAYDLVKDIQSNYDLGANLGLKLAEGQTEYAVEDITRTVDQYVRSGALSKEQGEDIKSKAVGREADALVRKASGGDKNAAMDLFVLTGEYGTKDIADKIDGFTWNYNAMMYPLKVKIGDTEYSIGCSTTNETPKDIEFYQADKKGWGIVNYNGELYCKTAINNGPLNDPTIRWVKMSDKGGSSGTIPTGTDEDSKDGKITQVSWDTVKQLLLEKVLKIEGGTNNK